MVQLFLRFGINKVLLLLNEHRPLIIILKFKFLKCKQSKGKVSQKSQSVQVLFQWSDLTTREFVLLYSLFSRVGKASFIRHILQGHIGKKRREQRANEPGVNKAILLGHHIFMNWNTAWLGNRHIIAI